MNGSHAIKKRSYPGFLVVNMIVFDNAQNNSEKKNHDQQFINIIWKLLKAGYMDMRRARQDSLAGVHPGAIVENQATSTSRNLLVSR